MFNEEEYYSYHNRVKRNNYTKFILLIDEFDESYKEMFKDENIDVIDLSKIEKQELEKWF